MLRGGYLLAGDDRAGGKAPLVLVASGSEVACAVEARALLQARGIEARLVSMPCPQIFLQQPEEYRARLIPRPSRVVVIEAAATQGWDRIAGPDALLIGIDRFGASAPAEVLAEKYGFTGPQVADRIVQFLRTF